MITRQWMAQARQVSSERCHTALRLTLSCLLLTLLFLSLQLPFLAVAIIVVFYVTQKNVVLTAGIGLGFIVVALLALGEMLLIIKVTYDYPLIRLVTSLFLFFWAMFFMRVLGKLGLAFFVVGLVLIYAQTFPSMTGESEVIVRLILWLWTSMVVAIGVIVLVNACFVQAYPHYQFGQQVADLYEQAADRLQTAPAIEGHVGIIIAEHLSQRQTLFKLACLTNGRFKQQKESWCSLSNMAMRCVELAEAYRLNPTKNDSYSAQALAHCFRQLAEQARQRQLPTPLGLEITPAEPILIEISELYHQFASGQAIVPPPGHSEKPPLMAADAWRNPIYLQFALKTLLASLICYLFYTATAWQGVHTIMLSCVIVAQPGLGATYQKAILRITGALCAAGAAVLCMVFIQPHLDTVVGLLLMCLPIFALSAWLAAGTERVAYAGIQLGFTFALLFLSGFGPMSNLTELRDRMIGIVLGVIVASIVYLYLWPDSDAPRLRRGMANLYRQLSHYFAQPAQNATPLPIYQCVQQVEELANRLCAEPLASTTLPYRYAAQWPINESVALAQQLAILATGYHRCAGSDDRYLAYAATWLGAYASHLAEEGEYPLEAFPHPDRHNPYATALDKDLRRLAVWPSTALQTTQEVNDGT
ncbi:multidrug transporter subunit MdtO [Rosenbergiella sp. S61]|uniref:Multidrug transporter subunit MdtO n=1 Tax=Rosenbergiella gaditana TaxID=2726987 RepID=A0ABS5SY13_9GAMM|nr:FUSC family protein [Rosenbergiella gaditana]MBT0724976.1 multidrug transporter subunit MdtO [Rosenbergiella gaditana]